MIFSPGNSGLLARVFPSHADAHCSRPAAPITTLNALRPHILDILLHCYVIPTRPGSYSAGGGWVCASGPGRTQPPPPFQLARQREQQWQAERVRQLSGGVQA